MSEIGRVASLARLSAAALTNTALERITGSFPRTL